MTQWLLRLLVYPMFLASGAAGLIYEVTWTRQLLYTFGAGLYAVSAVLAAFMGGLALGAWLLGRVSDRLRRPLATYGLLELGICACGLVLPWALGSLHRVDGWAYRHWGQDFAILTAFRFALAWAAMLLPTTLMGATLPVLTRFLVRDSSHLGLHVSGLYAINTFGAVAGAFLAGFVMIERLGLRQTQWAAAGLNALVGVSALALATIVDLPRRAGADPAAPPLPTPGAPKADDDAPPPLSPAQARWILLTSLIAGLVSLGAQAIWSRSLVFTFEYLKNTTYAFSAMLTIFLAGLAIGSALIGLVIDHQRRLTRLYGILLTLIGLSIALSAMICVWGSGAMKLANPLDPVTGKLNWVLAVANIMLQTIGVVGVPTLLMGMAFPVAARVMARVDRVGGDVGLLYSFNTVGAILGSLVTAFVVIPMLGLTKGLLLLGAVDVAIGLATIWREEGGRAHVATLGLPAWLALMIVGWKLSGPQAAILQPVNRGESGVAFYEEGPLATVAVVENRLGDRTIYVDGVGVAGTDAVLQTDQKSLAHVPMMLLGRAASALTVGFGSGGASFSLQLHDRLAKIDCVEICKTVLRAAPTLTAANHDFFGDMSVLDYARQNGRYSMILDDARAWLRYTPQRYDFIATDCTDLRYKSNANLYDVGYFQACRERLTKDGIVVVWMPLSGMTENVFKIALRTFRHVFPQMAVFYMDNESTHYILLVGWQDKIQLDYRLFQQTLEERDVRQDLSELQLDDPVKLLSCFITGGDALARYLGDGPLNTEDHPLIEFECPKYGFGDKPLIDNLNALMKARVSPRKFLVPGSMPKAEEDRLARYEEALPWIIEGHSHFRNIEQEGIFVGLEKAARCWMKALVIAPEDLSVKHQLQFPLVSRHIEAEPDNYFWPMILGRLYMIQDDRFKLDLAYDALTKAEQLLSDDRRRIANAKSGADANRQQAAIDRNLAAIHAWMQEIRKKAGVQS
jgi:spermidine synthase